MPVTMTMRLLIVCAVGAILSACSGLHESEDYERHRNSQLVEPRDRKDVLYFDVTYTAQYPEDDPAAEQVRMEWLAGWCETRKICPNGFEILNKREFGDLEYNPARHDARYEFICRSQPAE